MIKEKQAAIAKSVTLMFEYYNSELSKSVLELYVNELIEFHLQEIDTVIRNAIRERKWCPKISELLDELEPRKRKTDRYAESQWSVLYAKAKRGLEVYFPGEDQITDRLISAGYSFEAIAAASDEDRLAMRERFLQEYVEALYGQSNQKQLAQVVS